MLIFYVIRNPKLSEIIYQLNYLSTSNWSRLELQLFILTIKQFISLDQVMWDLGPKKCPVDSIDVNYKFIISIISY